MSDKPLKKESRAGYVVNRKLTEEVARLRKENERLREALEKIRNDDTQQQKPYHFWSIANAALDSDAD